MKICPFIGVKFKNIPGYVPGYGCPLCTGLSYHVPLDRLEADRASPETRAAAFMRIWFASADIDDHVARIIAVESKIALDDSLAGGVDVP
jgi:hypothetical protein